MDNALRRFHPRKGAALQHQVTGFLRDLIRRNTLPPGQRLPPIRELAEMWGTNYFTVQAAFSPLVEEGLIVRRPRVGTFVRERLDEIHAVGIYHDHPLPSDPQTQEAFATTVHLGLYRRLSQRGISSMAWFDQRPQEEQTGPPAAMATAVREGLVQAVIVTSARAHCQPWLRQLQLPLAMIGHGPVPGSVDLNQAQMIDLALTTLAERGCRRVGVLSHMRPGDEMYSHFRDQATALNLECRADWIVANEREWSSLEACGYRLFRRLWRQDELPDGLFIFPDIAARGVFHAILEEQVDIPGDLRLVSHRNSAPAIFAPVPVDWLVLDIEAVVDGILTQVERLAAHQPAPPIRLPLYLESSG